MRRSARATAIRAPRWRSPLPPTPSSRGCCGTTRPTRTGPTATGSSCRCGHASILLYSMLYLTGYGLTLDDIKEFRQLGLGDPRVIPSDGTPTGVEVTTGPLGQGFGNSVGMAIAEANLRARFGAEICDHHTFVFCSRRRSAGGREPRGGEPRGPPRARSPRRRVGRQPHHDRRTVRACLVGRHAEPLPGIRVGRQQSTTTLSPTTSTPSRRRCAEAWTSRTRRRSSPCAPTSATGRACRTTRKAHGAALGEDVIREAKERLGLPPDEDFYVPDDVLEFYERCHRIRPPGTRAEWEQRLEVLHRRSRRVGRGPGRHRTSRAGRRTFRRGAPARSVADPQGAVRRCSTASRTSFPASSPEALTSPTTPASA